MNIGKHILIAVIAASMSACGGGGGSSGGGTTASPAEGAWYGTTTTGRDIWGFVLNDGTYWFLYTAAGDPTLIAGAVQGNSTASNGSFSSTNGKDFSLEGLGISDFTMAGSYATKSSLAGTISYLSGPATTFGTTYSTFYDSTPSLAAIAGNYSGQTATSAGKETATVVISTSGALSGYSASGCSFTGSAAPRASGNVYNVSVTFGGGVCAQGTNTVTGIAYISGKAIQSVALNSARTDGFIYVGTKP